MAEKYDRRKNLVSLKDRTPEERAEIARKGQAASVEARRRKKTLREIMEAVLSLEAPQDMLEAGNEIARKMQRLAKSRGEVVDVYEAIAMAQAHRAAQGDTAAATWVRDSAGDKPTDKLAQTGGPELTEADIALLRKLDKAGTLDVLTDAKSGKDG